jgi:hypothetical protein
MNKRLEINVKKIMLMYFVGFTSAMLLPNKYYVNLVNIYHNKILESIEIEDRENFIKIN